MTSVKCGIATGNSLSLSLIAATTRPKRALHDLSTSVRTSYGTVRVLRVRHVAVAQPSINVELTDGCIVNEVELTHMAVW